MLDADLALDPPRERKQLLFLAAGFPLVAGTLWWLLDARVLPAVLLSLAALALAGAALHRWIGRDVFLLFSLFALAVGGVVSRVVLLVTYVVAFGLFGSLMRLVGMDELRKSFTRNKRRESMFWDAPETSPDSFLRQS